jgi:hypothetical protein
MRNFYGIILLCVKGKVCPDAIKGNEMGSLIPVYITRRKSNEFTGREVRK